MILTATRIILPINIIAAAIDTAAAADDDDEQCFSHKSLAVGRTQHCVSCTTAAVYNCRRHRCNRKEYYAAGVAYWEGTTHCCTNKDWRRIAELKAEG